MKKPLVPRPALLLALASAFLLFSACSPSVILTVRNNASGTGVFNAELSPTAEGIALRFAGPGANSDKGKAEAPIFDRDKITYSLARAGFRVDSLEFPSRTGLKLALSFLSLDSLLSHAVLLEKNNSGISITLSRESVNDAVDLMPPDTRNFLDLLMAPVFTGEQMDRAEYEQTIGAAYGKTLAEELKNSVFSLTVHCPAPVRSASVTAPGITKATGSTAVFSIPLSVLMAMEQPVTAKVGW